jgi:hypothetical protein
VLLLAIVVGDVIQFWLARGPGRAMVYRLGRYLGLTPARLDAASTLVRKSGPLGLAVIMLTPGVRAAGSLSNPDRSGGDPNVPTADDRCGEVARLSGGHETRIRR